MNEVGGRDVSMTGLGHLSSTLERSQGTCNEQSCCGRQCQAACFSNKAIGTEEQGQAVQFASYVGSKFTMMVDESC